MSCKFLYRFSVNVIIDEEVVSTKRQETCDITTTYQIENNPEDTSDNETVPHFADNATQTSWSYTESSSSEWEVRMKQYDKLFRWFQHLIVTRCNK